MSSVSGQSLVTLGCVSVIVLACSGRTLAQGDAESGSTTAESDPTSSGLVTATSTGVEAVSDVAESTGSTGDEPTSASSDGSTGAADMCPPGRDEVAAVWTIAVDENWVWAEGGGVVTALCDGVAFEEPELRLACVQDGGLAEPQEVIVGGGGTPVAASLSALVGEPDLRLSVAYGWGFFPGPPLTPHFTLRNAEGDLLVLGSRNANVGPGEAVADVSVPDWTAPFTSLGPTDYGCGFRPNEPDTFPSAEQPFALEVGTDTGIVPIFHGEQETVEVDGVSYEVSVPRAVVYSEVCDKCSSADTDFSIVRHL